MRVTRDEYGHVYLVDAEGRRRGMLMPIPEGEDVIHATYPTASLSMPILPQIIYGDNGAIKAVRGWQSREEDN